MNKKRLTISGRTDKESKTQSLDDRSTVFDLNHSPKKVESQPFGKKSNIYPLNHKKPHYSKKPKGICAAIIASAAAIMIGTALGLLMLNMFAQLEEEPADHVSHINSIERSEETDTTSSPVTESARQSINLEAIQGFVLQAGVFSSKENANSWAVDYTSSNVHTMVWEREGQYFLLAGFAPTREQATELATSIEQRELEIFIKEWQTPAMELDVTTLEKEWLDAFKSVWDVSMTNATEQNFIDGEAWRELIARMPEDHESFQSFQEVIHEQVGDHERIEGPQVNHLLLSILQVYEGLSS